MGKIMEAVFCMFYLIFTMIIGIRIVCKSKGNKEFTLFGIMASCFDKNCPLSVPSK